MARDALSPDKTMRFMLILHGDEAAFGSIDPAAMDEVMNEYFAFTEALSKAGALVAGEELMPASSAKLVRRRGDVTDVVDGPFAEVREQFGGFYLIDVASESKAVEWAAKCPNVTFGAVEVRAVVDHG